MVEPFGNSPRPSAICRFFTSITFFAKLAAALTVTRRQQNSGWEVRWLYIPHNKVNDPLSRRSLAGTCREHKRVTPCDVPAHQQACA